MTRKLFHWLFALAVFWTGPAAVAAPSVKQPVLVEFFTAQGCAACISANKVSAGLADRADTHVLTFSVDYWDYLGWKDPFARAEFSARQKAYADTFKLREVYTPQIVIDGRAQVPGGNAKTVVQNVDRIAASARPVLDMKRMSSSRLAIGTGRARRPAADIWLIWYTPGETRVTVRKGDNRGQTLRLHNVVRATQRLGGWTGKGQLLRLPAPPEKGLAAMVVVQERSGGPLLGSLILSGSAAPLKP